MKWPTLTINDICKVSGGKRLPSGHNFKESKTNHPYIRITDMSYDTISTDNLLYISDETFSHISRYTISKDDLYISIAGTIGYVGKIPEFIDGANLTENCAKLSNFSNEIYRDFLLYYLRSSKGNGELLSRKGGASQPKLALERIKTVPVPVPPVEVQIRISNILSAYDDLIENNQKQIKLLEEAAMRLYKEWFVNLRFPGYEAAKIVDGVPQGWQQGQLKDCAEVNSRSISKKYTCQDMQYIDISSVNCGRIEHKTKYRLSDAPGRAKRLAVDGDTIWGMVRPNLKAYALVLSPDENDVFSTGFSILSPKSIPYTFLYCFVTQEAFVGYLVNCTNGSAYPAVKPIHFEEAKILIPESCLLEEFHKISDPMYRKVKAIETQNFYLQQARDSLLPKLMSGEIEV